MTAIIKTLDQHFIDWESWSFGYGYGSGEPHIIPALRRFLLLCNEGHYGTNYDYRKLEAELTPTVAWLLINTLCELHVIEYGTSPRAGWLTDRGRSLKEFVASRTEDELVALVTDWPDGYIHCSPGNRNCGPTGYVEGRECDNPFW